MKILITGINGQIGSALQPKAKKQCHQVVSVSRNQWDMAKFPHFGERLVIQNKPDIVINTAAYTNVDGAEYNQKVAYSSNAEAPRFLARGCKAIDIPLIHISTDYVFDGNKKTSYTETDNPNPLNVYGLSKLSGERAIIEEFEKFIILRTSWVFSKKGNNFVNTILRLANEQNNLTVANDQFGGPTDANNIAIVLMNFVNNHNNKWGIYHYSGQDFINWFSYAEIIVNFGFNNGMIKKIPNIFPCSTLSLNLDAARPKNSRLNTNKIKTIFEIKDYKIIELLNSNYLTDK